MNERNIKALIITAIGCSIALVIYLFVTEMNNNAMS